MKYGLISDVHGNWEALQLVLKQLRNQEEVDKLWFTGDLVGYGPSPNKCVSALADFPATAVMGNHDAGVVGDLDMDFFNRTAREALKWTKTELKGENRGFVAGLSREVYRSQEEISLVHGSSANPLTHYITSKADAYRSLRSSDENFKLQVFGHTHLPIIYECEGNNVTKCQVEEGDEFTLKNEKRYLINPGSVGQPRDGNWKASYAVLKLNDDLTPGKVQFHRAEYPAEKVRGKIIDAGLPKELGDRLLQGR